MLTKKDWEQRDDLRIALAELLKTEPLKQALEVCLHQDIGAPLVLNPSDLLNHAALSGASREGYFRFYRALHQLAMEKVPHPEEPQPWKHVGKK